jgi:zinc protease
MTEGLQRVQPPVFPVTGINIPEVLTFNLDNEVPVYLIEAGTEDIIRVEFTFRAGQEREYLPLLASTTNSMLQEGSQNYTSEELHRLLDFYGIFLHFSFDKDRAGIVVFALSRHIEKVLELSLEIISRPAFPESELNALMKKRLQWFMINREKVQNVAMDQFFESLFGKRHPYGHQVTEEDFGNINSPLLADFHGMHYTPENMAVIISGKIPGETTALLNGYFGNLKSKKIYREEHKTTLKGSRTRKIHIEKPGTIQTAVRVGSATINKRHPDYPGLKILDSVLGGYFGSRLMKNIREEKGYTYGIRSCVSSLDLSGYKVISTEVGNKYLKPTLEEIYNEIHKLQNDLVHTAELEVVRNYMSGEMVRMFDGPFALAESFRSAWEFGLDSSYFYKLMEKIKTIDPDEIKSIANAYYNIDELYEITAGSK